MIGALFLAPSLAAQGQESWRDDAASGPSFFKQDFSAYDNATVEQKLAATLQTGDVLLMEKYKGDWQWLGWAAKWLEERLSGTVFNHVGVVVRDRREDVAYLFEHTLAGPALRAVDERIERSGARLLLLRRLQPPASPSAETALRIERIVYAAVTGREAGPEVDAAYLLQDAREELRRRDELASPLRTASAFALRLATLARTAAAAALASQASPHESTVPHAVARLLALEASVAEHEAALAEARARLMGPSPASGSAERTVDYRVGLQKEMRLRTEQLDADRTELEALRSRLPALVARCARREGDAGPFPSTGGFRAAAAARCRGPFSRSLTSSSQRSRRACCRSSACSLRGTALTPSTAATSFPATLWWAASCRYSAALRSAMRWR
jgi:hypothetical protein